MTVERVRVGEVLRLERRPVTPDPTLDYSSIGVRSFGKGIFHYEATPGDRLGKLRFFEVIPDRLVVSNIKAWEGAVAVSSVGDAGCIASNRFLTYTPVDDRINVRWARWFFLSDRGNELLQRASPGSADRNRTLAIDRFEALEIPLPPIDEQRHVAGHLDELESAIAELRTKVELAALLNRALMVSAAVRSDLDSVSKRVAGWRKIALRDVLSEQIDAVAVEADRIYQIAGVYSFGRGIFEQAELDGSATSYRALHRLRSGQLVMSRLKAWEGAIALVPEAYDGWFLSPEFPTFDVDATRADVGYLVNVVTSEQFWTRLSATSRGIGARRERVRAQRLLEQGVELPPLPIQRATARAIDVALDVSARRSAMAKRIDALVPAALNEAFAGLS